MDKVSGLLKAFVIGAGILLIAGTLVLAALLVQRALGGGDAGSPARPGGAVELALPDGARIEQIVPDGRRVLLLGVAGDDRQFLAVVDPETGERLSLIRFRTDGDESAPGAP